VLAADWESMEAQAPSATPVDAPTLLGPAGPRVGDAGSAETPVRSGFDVGTGARSRATPARKAFHILLGVLSWVGFAALWVWQLEVSVPADWGVAVAGLVVVLAIYGIYVTGWVAWNRNIYRRRHRRTEALEIEVGFERDSLGRSINADPRLVLHPGEVVVTVSDDEQVKHYVAVR